MTWVDLCKRLTCADSCLKRLRKHEESRLEHLEGWYLQDGGSLDLAVKTKLVGSSQILGLFSKSNQGGMLNLIWSLRRGGGGESKMTPKLSIRKDGIVGCE